MKNVKEQKMREKTILLAEREKKNLLGLAQATV